MKYPPSTRSEESDRSTTIGSPSPFTTPFIERRFTKGGMEVRQHKKKYEMVVIHTARRTLATLLVNSGLQYHQVMKITGHKKITTLQKYIKSDIDLQKMIEVGRLIERG